MMHMGEMTKTFIGIGKEEQADIKPEDAKHANNVAALLGIDAEWMINYFCSKYFNVFFLSLLKVEFKFHTKCTPHNTSL